MIDSGMQIPNAREIAESITDLPLQLLNTHADPDHISGNGMFDSVLMSPMEEALYRAHGGKAAIVSVQSRFFPDKQREKRSTCLANR